jgi:hypothetical protein
MDLSVKFDNINQLLTKIIISLRFYNLLFISAWQIVHITKKLNNKKSTIVN